MNYNPIHPHCGPFNSVSDLRPNDPVDAACWEHDKSYALRPNAYVEFGDDDERLIEQLEQIGGFAADQYSAPFRLKRRLADLGYIPDARAVKIQKVESFGFSVPNKSFGKSVSLHQTTVMPYRSGHKRHRKYGSEYGLRRKRKNYVTREGCKRMIMKYAGMSPACRFTGTDSYAIRDETNYNQVTYYSTYINSSAFLQTYLSTYTPQRVRQNAAHTGVELVQENVAASNLAYINAKVKIEGGVWKYTLKNNSLYSQEVRVYIYKCMQDTSTTINTLLDQAINEKYNNTKTKATMMGFYPSEVESYFSSFWDRKGRVLKAMIEPGQRKVLKIKVPKGTFNGHLDNSFSNDYAKHFTLGVLFRVVGGAVHDSTSKDNVGTDLRDIDVLMDQQCKYRLLNNIQEGVHYATGNLDSITSGISAKMDVDQD